MFRGVRGPPLQSTLLHARGLWMSFKKRFNYTIKISPGDIWKQMCTQQKTS